MFNSKSGIVLLLILLSLITLARPVQAATFSKTIVTITFDDQKSGQRTIAADILKGAGFKATAFVVPSLLTGLSDTLLKRDVTDLQNIYGWEIGSRGMTDKGLSNCTSSDCYNYEIQSSQSNLTQMGLAVSTFAYPTGSGLTTNNNIRAVIEAVYAGARQSSMSARVPPPYIETAGVDIYRVSVNTVTGDTAVDTVNGWIDQAIASKGWLVLGFKQILNMPNPHGSTSTRYLSADFSAIINYLKIKVEAGTVQVMTFRAGIDLVNSLRGNNTGGTGGLTGNNGILGLLTIPLIVVGIALLSGIGIGLHRFNSRKRRRVYSGPTPAR